MGLAVALLTLIWHRLQQSIESRYAGLAQKISLCTAGTFPLAGPSFPVFPVYSQKREQPLYMNKTQPARH